MKIHPLKKLTALFVIGLLFTNQITIQGSLKIETAKADPPGGMSIGLSAIYSNTAVFLMSIPIFDDIVTGYTMQYRVHNNSNGAEDNWVTSNHLVVTDVLTISQLTPNTDYDFRAFEVNNDGSGPASNVVEASTTQSLFTSGDGLSADTAYDITTCQQLQKVGTDNYDAPPADYYKLGGDINCSVTNPGNENFDSSTWTSSGFAPIGETETGAFQGHFDGQSHTVDRLYMNYSNSDIGLFGHIALGAEIKNIGVTNVNITGTNESTGALVGYSLGTVFNSYSTGTVVGGDEAGGLVGSNDGQDTIYNSYSTVNVTGTGFSTGGLAGANYGTIHDSFAIGNVTNTTGHQIGGVVGMNSGTLTNSYYSTGTVSGGTESAYSIGGLAGYNSGSIFGSYSAGTVDPNSMSLVNTGGFIGYLNGGTLTNNDWTNPDNDLNAIGNPSTGLLVTNSYGQDTALSNIAQFYSTSHTVYNVFNGEGGWDFATSPVWDSHTDHFPTIHGLPDPYQVSDSEGEGDDDDFTTGLQAHWDFDEAGGSTAYDSSGNNHSGTLDNSPSRGTGKFGNALSFNGSNTNVDFGLTNFGLTNTFTIGTWVKINTDSARQAILSKTAGSNDSWLIEVDPADCGTGRVSFFINTSGSAGGGINLCSITALTTGVWHHVAMTYDGSTLRSYIDGVNTASVSDTGSLYDNSASVHTLIGNWSDGDRPLNGSVDDTVIYNRVLTSDQIADLYDGENISLIGYWKMDDGEGATATDSSGFGNTGSVSGNPIWGLGEFDNAFSFDGSTRITTSLELPTANYTKSAWIKLSSCTNNGDNIISSANDTGTALYALNCHIHAGQNAEWDMIHDTDPLVAGTWNLVTLTYDAHTSTLRLYENGAFVASSEVSIPNSVAIHIGGHAAGSLFNGLIDDARVYNRTLSSDDVQALYAQHYTQPAPSITAVISNSGQTDGGDTVVLRGENFSIGEGGTVTFDGTPGTNISATSNTITVTSPSHAVGDVALVVKNDDGQTTSTTFTYKNPISVASCTDLSQIGSDIDHPLDGYYKLTDNIDCQDQSFTDIGGDGFDPSSFSGTFNGDGHYIARLNMTGWGLFANTNASTIENLQIFNSRLDSYQGQNNVGMLIGYANNTVISHVKLSNISVQLDQNGNAGGLIGRASQSYVLESAIDGETTNVSATYHPIAPYAGGLAGRAESTLFRNSYFIGNVNSNHGTTGGIASVAEDSSFTNVYSAGQFTHSGYSGGGGSAGGITASTIGTFAATNSFSAPTFDGNSEGGLIRNSGSTATLDNNYFSTEHNNVHCIQNNTDEDQGSDPDGCSSTPNDSTFYSSSNAPLTSWNFNTIWSTRENNFPELRGFVAYSQPGKPTNLQITSSTDTTASLSWSAPESNGGTDLINYIVEYSIHGDDNWNQFTHDPSTGTTITVTGLQAATLYDFRVSAVSLYGTGDTSDVASELGDTTPPVISDVAATPDVTTAHVTWTTDETSSSKVNYGLTSDYDHQDQGEDGTSHSVNLTELSSCTTYHYNVVSKDTSNNRSNSDDATFATLGCTTNNNNNGGGSVPIYIPLQVNGGGTNNGTGSQNGNTGTNFPFTDLGNHFSLEFVKILYDMGIIQGRTATEYQPDGLLTRAEMVKIAVLTFKYPLSDDLSSLKKYSDIDPNAWYPKYIAAATTAGIVEGYTDGTFRPNQTIKRDEVLKILILAAKKNYHGSQTSPFIDVPPEAWFKEFVDYAYANGIIQGRTPTLFAPEDDITRGEMAKVDVKTFQLP